MNSDSRIFRRRKQSATWTFLNPEERATLAAGQLNAQNQKVQKDLEVITKGLEDEKRCEKVARTKEQLMLQNRLNRLSRTSIQMERRTLASVTSIEATSPYLAGTSSGREIMKKASEALQQKNVKETQAKLQQWYSETDSSRRGSFFNTDQGGLSSIDQSDRRKVRFDNEKYNEEEAENKTKTLPSRESTLVQSGINSPRSGMSSAVNLSNSKHRGSVDSYTLDDDRCINRSKLVPSCLDYYAAPMTSRITMQPCKGFSHNSVTFQSYPKERNSLNQISGLNNEMTRWRRLSTTRATNARLKAIRPLGRRHTTQSLHEAMDENAKMRKETAVRSLDFSPHAAWQMLNCRYLRLTPNNIKMLEQVCGDAGYDISTHPHSKTNLETDLKFSKEKEVVMNDMFETSDEDTFLVA